MDYRCVKFNLKFYWYLFSLYYYFSDLTFPPIIVNEDMYQVNQRLIEIQYLISDQTLAFSHVSVSYDWKADKVEQWSEFSCYKYVAFESNYLIFLENGTVIVYIFINKYFRFSTWRNQIITWHVIMRNLLSNAIRLLEKQIQMTISEFWFAAHFQVLCISKAKHDWLPIQTVTCLFLLCSIRILENFGLNQSDKPNLLA